MKIPVIGTGRVGSVVGKCPEEMGNDVPCHDVDRRKLVNLETDGIHEPGLVEVWKCVAAVTACKDVAKIKTKRSFGSHPKLRKAESPSAAPPFADSLTIDGRNLYEPSLLKLAKLTYGAIGRH